MDKPPLPFRQVSILDDRLDFCFSQFEVELEADPSRRTVEALSSTALGFPEGNDVMEHGEGVSVPVKDGNRFWKDGQAGVLCRHRGAPQWKPSQFFFRIFNDHASEGFGQELSAQTDPQDGEAGFQGLGENRFFGIEPRVLVRIRDPHGPAHDDEGIHGIESGRGRVFEPGVLAGGMPVGPGPVGNVAQPFVGDVLEPENLHGGDVDACPLSCKGMSYFNGLS